MAEVITIANRKGGVGKTTTTLNLAYSLKELGKKVLVIDLDPQANLTRCFDVENTENIKNIGHLLITEMEEESYLVEDYTKSYDEIDIIPSSIYLSAVETQMRVETGSERILFEIVNQIKEYYEYVLIDTSPSLNILTINALCASDSVLITADTQLFAIVGISELLKTIQKIKKRVNASLTIKGILLTMCDNRTNLSKLLTQQVEEMYQGKIAVFQTKIPKTVKVGEAIYSGQSIKKYAKGSSVDIAYDNLAKEICYE
ncbi:MULTISPECIES: ParA family protein [Streptococcus anginosus group]|uniref:ParA family protein n=1 Tax=Streptococcus anginosus group TaxID=671232 RepID=UPI000E3D792B|nr:MULTISPECIES: AAA family ATPase [Streptococcus anginosus group]MCY7227540.1 AAA family ATPase [Streptococcus anginosus]HEO3639275.1 ParA family protein [Streptococcus agalactiae]HEO4582357.1 ParA family protein [Streptococcus agalactiae]HEP4950130.1 ParA family protein [Streptococcus pyogenes]